MDDWEMIVPSVNRTRELALEKALEHHRDMYTTPEGIVETAAVFEKYLNDGNSK